MTLSLSGGASTSLSLTPYQEVGTAGVWILNISRVPTFFQGSSHRSAAPGPSPSLLRVCLLLLALGSQLSLNDGSSMLPLWALLFSSAHQSFNKILLHANARPGQSREL